MVSWSAGNEQLTIITVRTSGDLCSFDSDCSFIPRLDARAAGVITATEGSLLNSRILDYWTSVVLLG